MSDTNKGLYNIRPFVAEELIGSSAPVEKSDPETEEPSLLTQRLSEQEVKLPEDFVITMFDEIVLNMSYPDINTSSAEEIAEKLTKMYKVFLRYLYEDRDNRSVSPEFNKITKGDVNNYFDVLTGKKDHDFPEFRDRFNLAYTFYKAKKEGKEVFLPEYKGHIQYEFAKKIVDGITHEGMMSSTKIRSLSASTLLMATIKLDLMEKYTDEAVQVMDEAIRNYEDTYPDREVVTVIEKKLEEEI